MTLSTRTNTSPHITHHTHTHPHTYIYTYIHPSHVHKQLQNLVAALKPHSLYSTWGACPDVTLGGYLTGGGEGPALSWAGMGLDSVVQMDVVLADGRLVTASASQHPDLFWALRGGGGPATNFGVVVQYVLALHPAPAVVTDVEITAVGLSRVLQLYEAFAAVRNTTTLSLVVFYASSPSALQALLSGWFEGSESEAREQLAPLLALPGVTANFVQSDLFSLSQLSFDSIRPLKPTQYLWKSTYGSFAPISTVNALFELAAAAPAGIPLGRSMGNFLWLQIYNGKMLEKPSMPTAFPARGEAFGGEPYLNWEVASLVETDDEQVMILGQCNCAC
jgi:hypothetical protein